MMNKSNLLIGITVCLLIALAVSDQARAHFKFLSEESDAYRVDLKSWERYGPEDSKARFILRTKRLKDGRETNVLIENDTTGLKRAEIVGDRLILFGEAGSRSGCLTIVDLSDGQVIDFIRHYGAALSLNRRYLVIRSFYPARGMQEAQSDVVLLYDLERSSTANRLGSEKSAVSGMNVGIPVYPPANVSPQTYRVWIPEKLKRHHVWMPEAFLWVKEDQEFFFIDRTEAKTLLVSVDLSAGSGKPVIATRAIDVGPILALDPESPEYAEVLARERAELAIEKLELGPEGSIVLKLSTERYRKKIYRTTQVTIPFLEAGSEETP